MHTISSMQSKSVCFIYIYKTHTAAHHIYIIPVTLFWRSALHPRFVLLWFVTSPLKLRPRRHLHRSHDLITWPQRSGHLSASSGVRQCERLQRTVLLGGGRLQQRHLQDRWENSSFQWSWLMCCWCIYEDISINNIIRALTWGNVEQVCQSVGWRGITSALKKFRSVKTLNYS